MMSGLDIHEITNYTKKRNRIRLTLTEEEFFKYYFAPMTRLFNLILVLGVFLTCYASAPAQKGKTPPKRSQPKATSTNKTSTAVTVNPALKLQSTYEKQLFDEINYARANPQEYLKALELFRKNYRGKE